MTMQANQDENYLTEQIRSRIRALNSEHFQHVMAREYGDDYIDSEMDAWIHNTLKRIYILILVYLEKKNLILIAGMFKQRFELKLDDSSFMLDETLRPLDEMRTPTLTRLEEFEDFLLPFHEFDVFREEKRLSASYLDSVLSNTNYIIKKTKANITNETSVYNSVKWFLEILFPDTLVAKAPIFPGKFKNYKPDLYVPELQTAIEYKFVKSGDHPETYIDEIYIDSVNYKGDDRYQFFTAVMYFVNNQEFKPDTIKSCWKRKNFPSTWKLILVFG